MWTSYKQDRNKQTLRVRPGSGWDAVARVMGHAAQMLCAALGLCASHRRHQFCEAFWQAWMDEAYSETGFWCGRVFLWQQ